MERKPQRKMTNIDVVETSGVDHPAHLREGWLVKKAATQADIDALFGNVTKQKEETVAENEATAGPTQEEFDALVAKNAEQAAKIEELVAKAAEAPVEKAAEIEETGTEALLKSVPQEVRDMIAKAESDAAEARAEIAKERDARLDAEAVTISKASYRHVAMDHEAIAPALRRVAVIDADLAKAVTSVLKAAEGQLESAGIFAEIGKAAADENTGSLDAVVKSLQAADPALGYSEAVAKAVEADPSLYTAYLEGK